MKIRELLKRKTFFITGATGFLGQPLVEKILWLEPEVRRIYVLIRRKKQLDGRIMTAEERLEKELFSSSVFERLRAIYKEDFREFLRKKVVVVPGDVCLKNLGIDDITRKQIQAEVDVVVNSAALVSFDAPLSKALKLNARSAVEVANFANGCGRALLVHVSTAYVSATNRKIAPETLHTTSKTKTKATQKYPLGLFKDPEKEVSYLEEIVKKIQAEAESPNVSRELTAALLRRFRRSGAGGKKSGRREKIENLRKKWIEDKLTQKGLSWARARGWNDTYTYTKALGEQLVVKNRPQNTTTVIIRPAVIESSLAEPSPGWLDGLRMADPIIVAIGKGRLRSLPMNPKVCLDIIPVDMVVNALISSLGPAFNQTGVSIYQVATGDANPVSLGKVYSLVYNYFVKNPMLSKVGQPIKIKPIRFSRPTFFRFGYKVKAAFLDATEKTLKALGAVGVGQLRLRRIAVKKVALQKLYYYGKIYGPYLTLDCRFKTTNTLNLFTLLSKKEKQDLNFDVSQLNWRHYIQNIHIPGVKKYILKLEGGRVAETNPGPPKQDPRGLTINQLLDRSAKKFPHKVALQIKKSHQWHRVTYRELWLAAQAAGNHLRKQGFKKGDRLVLYSQNQPEWGVAYLGAVGVGLVVVPLDAQTWHKEVWGVAKFTTAVGLLTSKSCLKKLHSEDLRKNEKSKSPLRIMDVEGQCRPFQLSDYPRSTGKTAPKIAPQFQASPDDLASIIFTNSVLVEPKGAMHTHQNFIANLWAVNCHLPIEKNDQVVSVLPLYHALEFTCGFLLPIYGGATVSYLHSLKPRVILETMQEVGATCMLGVPTLYALIREDINRRILKSSRSLLRSKLLDKSKSLSLSAQRKLGSNLGQLFFARVRQQFSGRIRFFVSGGSRLGRELYDDFRALGMPIYEGYGLTETAPVLTVNPLGKSRKGSAGKTIPGVELRILRPNKDGIGEILVQTPSLMKGYYRNSKSTAAAIKDGWFHTGDLGWVDVDGYVYITGRTKRVIVTGAGKNVYPADLEAIYSQINGAEEVCVLGVKNGLTEDIHGIFSVKAETFKGIAPEEIKEAVQRRVRRIARELPSYQRLQRVHVMLSPLPRSAEGAPARETIRDWLLLRLGTESSKKTTSSSRQGPTQKERLLLQELSRLSGISESKIQRASHLYTDLGLDSLMAIELLLFAESHLGVEIQDERASQLETVGQLVKELETLAPASTEGKEKLANRGHLAPFIAPRSMLSHWIQSAFLLILRVFYQKYFQLHLRGTEHIPATGPYIIAANHSSHLDTPAILTALGCSTGLNEAKKVRVLGAKDYFFDTPVRGWLFNTLLNVVPVEREDNTLAGLRIVGRLLSNNNAILIFPEGTRSRTGKLQPFKPGLGLIAMNARVSILPAYIEGTYNALPPDRRLPRRSRLQVTFAPPISMDEYARADGSVAKDQVYREITGRVRDAIEKLAIKLPPGVKGANS